ncbi:MAG TPA: hypothetical protein VNW94_26650 [Streptosporangiaceae bacterium]|nr:hypothetical protein [Streptosporangiaceae bacterium]
MPAISGYIKRDPASLARLQQIIGGNMERFTAREGLTVQWVPN